MKNLIKTIITIVLCLMIMVGVAEAVTKLFPTQGGTGTSTAPTLNQILIGTSGGVYIPSSTLTVDSLSDGTLTITGGNLTTTGTITSGDITIFDTLPILIFKDSNSVGGSAQGYIEWRDSNNTRLGFFGNSSLANDDLVWKNESSGGHIEIKTTGGGEFQISAATTTTGLLEVASAGTDYFAITNMTEGDILLVDSAGNLNATFVGALTGNASTASALASNPTDCGSNTWATTIAANGNLTCSAITYAGISAMTSANWRGVLNDEVGTGYSVFNASPNFTGSIGINDSGPDSALEVVSAGDDYFMISSTAGGDGNILLVDSVGNFNFGAGNLTTTGILTADTISVGTAYTFPNTDGNASDVLQTDGSGTVSWSAAGAGDVTAVGNCAAGLCLDGSSDGGTDITFYNIDSNKTQLIAADVASDLTITMPGETGTLALTSVATLSSLTSIGTIATGTWEGTDVAAGYGGTGLSDPTDHAVLVGSGATALTELTVGTNGQLLIGSTGADPVFAALTCGDNITCTTGAGTLEIDVDDAFLKNDATDEGVGLTFTGDNTTANTAYVPMVLYDSDATAPAASGFPIGTIYIQYTP